MKKYLYYGLLAISGLTLLFTSEWLSYSPFETEVKWQYPNFIVANENGEVVVMNHTWRSLVFLDSDLRVRSIVSTGLEKNKIQHPTSLEMTSNAVYVADNDLTESGTKAKGCNIMRFSLDGKFEKLVYEEKYDKAVRVDISMRCLHEHDGKLYALGRRGDNAQAMRIENGEKTVLREAPAFPMQMRWLEFSPKNKLIMAGRHDGKVVTYPVITKEPRVIEEAGCVHGSCMSPDGWLYLMDSKYPCVWRVSHDWKAEKLISDRASRICATTSKVYYTSGISDVGIYDLKTRKLDKMSKAEYSDSLLWKVRLSWGSLALLVSLAIYGLVWGIVVGIRSQRNAEKQLSNGREVRAIGIFDLYGGPFVLALVIFIVVVSTLSVDYYTTLCNRQSEAVMNYARTLKNMSPLSFGDALAKLNENSEPNSEEFITTQNSFAAMCGQSKGNDAGAGLTGIIVRYTDSGDAYCLMSLSSLAVASGTKMNTVAERGLRKSEVLANAARDEITKYSFDGYDSLAVPLRDSKNNLVGIAYLAANSSHWQMVFRNKVSELTIDLLSQMLVLVMLFGECVLLLRFWKMRKESIAAGEPKHTFCEAQRPLKILQGIAMGFCISFLPTISRDSAMAQGLSSELMITLPLVMLSAVNYLGRMTLQDLVSRSPKGGYYFGCLLVVVHAVLLGVFAVGSNYWVLVAAMAACALAGAVIDCANISVRACGREPAPEYRLLVFTNMEPTVGDGIGVALGAFLFSKLGYTAVIVAAFASAAIMALITKVFIHSDIGSNRAATAEGEESAGETAFLPTIRFCLSPSMLAIMLCILMPVGIIWSFEGYALPLFNEESGSSVMLVGFILIVVKFISLFLMPAVIKFADSIGNKIGMGLVMVVVLLPVLLFGISPNMVIMVLIVLGYGLLEPVVATCAERQQIEEAENHGISYESAAKYLVVGEAVAYSAGAPIFCWILAGGYSCLGYTIFAVGFVLLAIYGVIMLLPGRNKKGIAKWCAK